jgi:hypothetical protein
MACAICEDRRPRRFCPGVRAEICSLCCGTEREVSVNCPLECEYLQEARRHEKPQVPGNSEFSHRDIEVSEKLLLDNEELLTFLSATIFRTAMDTPGVADGDVHEALESLIRTYRTLQSGLYYDSRPTNPLAGAIFGSVQDALAEYRRLEHEQLGLTKTRNADCLGLLVFLQHLEIDRNNGRRRGRAFLNALRAFHMAEPELSPSSESSIIFP